MRFMSWSGFATVPTRSAVALLLLCAAPSAEARAQASTTPAAGDACAEEDISQSPTALQLRELSLKPGGKIDPATFMADPKATEFIAKLTQREQARKQRDWSYLCRYRAENAKQAAKGAPDVVFLGDSITDNWRYGDPGYFNDKVIDRGISGQTSSQILLRFYPDVVALRPKAVHIIAGTNDILQGGGIVGDDDIINNISAMIDMAKTANIGVVLGAIPPISVRAWQPNLKPAARLVALNEKLRRLAGVRGVAFVDYFAALKDADDGLRADLGNDGVHPNRDGYVVMRKLSERAIETALAKKN